MITLDEVRWLRLCVQLKEEHGASTMLIRSKMKEVLGFTTRYGSYTQFPNRAVYLDFFDEAKETWFRLKYYDQFAVV